MSERGTVGLVAAACSGDERAWGELVRRYTPLVLSVIRSYGLDQADAADVNQTVWLRVVEHLGRLREANALPAWLITTTRRECHRLLRLHRWTQPFDPYDDSVDGHIGARLLVDPVTPDDDLLRAERQQALRKAFAQLAPRCRELLTLLMADPPVSYREIGARLGMPMGSVGPTQARCLHKLRNCPALAPFVRPRPEPARDLRPGADQGDVGPSVPPAGHVERRSRVRSATSVRTHSGTVNRPAGPP